MEPGCNPFILGIDTATAECPQWSPAMEPACNRFRVMAQGERASPQWSPAMEPGCNGHSLRLSRSG